MSRISRSLLTALVLAVVASQTVLASPSAQASAVDATVERFTVYPLGTAKVEVTLTNASTSEEVVAFEILLFRADGSLVRAHLTDALAMAPGTTVPATYLVYRGDGAVRALVTPRSWPDLAP